jgi:hypothetical protein
VSTIEGHLAKAVETGRLEITAFIAPQEMAEIYAAIRELPESFASKDLFDKLKAKYSYGKLRAAMVEWSHRKENGHRHDGSPV